MTCLGVMNPVAIDGDEVIVEPANSNQAPSLILAMEDQALHPTAETSAALSEECIALFKRAGLFKDISEQYPHWSEDQLARFNIWLANLGVFENGHASIEYRLRDHPDVLNLVTNQLQVLRFNLAKLNGSLYEPNQSQLHRQETTGPESFDIGGEVFIYDSPTSEDSFSSDLEFEKMDRLNLKLLEGLQNVEETIARLNALSTAIRRSGKQSRTSKADLYEVIEVVDGARINVTKEFQKYASAIVAREIPDAENFLKERLSISIARRRNRYQYWKRHDKMSKIYVKKIVSNGLVKELQITQRANISQAEDLSIKKLSRPRDERTIMTGFTATTFDAQNFQRPTESARGSMKPIGSVRWKNKEEFPKPPKVGMKESHFVCPICLILSPAKEAKGDLWIQHVTRDLKPYICVFDDCKTPQTVFENFHDWIGHMKEEQMTPEWHCASASHPLKRFDSLGLFESHMREQHSEGFIEAQLPALANMNMRFKSDVFTACPFCSYNQDADDSTPHSALKNQNELQYHISSHLLSLAFISLPPLNTGHSSGCESSDSSRAAFDSRMGHSERESFQFDEATRFEDIPPSPDPVESSIKITEDWTWDFVWESLSKQSIRDEGSPDSVLGRLCKMQQKLAQTENSAFDNNVDRRQQTPNPRTTTEDGGKADIIGASNDYSDGTETKAVGRALPSPESESGLDAAKMFRQTVEDREEILGPDHPETITSVNNLAQFLFFQGQYKDAAVLFRQALEGRMKVLGEGHLDSIKSLNNLAQATVYLGQFKEAEKLYRKALAAGEETLGPAHPYVLQNIHNLGGALRNQGQHKGAEELYRRALAGRERVLGPDHPDTMQSVNNLGGTFEKMGQYKEAEELYRQALTAREKVLGSEHADTLQSVHNVAGALRNQGRYTEAESFYQRALSGREKTLGWKHPNTLRSLNNLALVLEEQDKYVEAEETYRQALVMREEVLGKTHPDTFQSINNIGNVRLKQLDYAMAELLHRQAFEGRTTVLGLEHPDTLQSIRNLGKVLEQTGRLEEAEILYRQALEERGKLLGSDHPHTLQSANDLSLLLERQGKIDDTEKVYFSMDGKADNH